jgi:hypothetical protein
MTDLSDFANLAKVQDDGVNVEILHPKTAEPLGMVFRVAGPDSTRQKRARSAVNNARLQMSRNKRLTAAELEADGLKVMVASIISWSGVEENGQPIEFSTETATDVLTRFPFIREQIDAVVGDRAGFIAT